MVRFSMEKMNGIFTFKHYCHTLYISGELYPPAATCTSLRLLWELRLSLPSLDMPTDKHFCRRQCWQRFLLVRSIRQLFCRGHEYDTVPCWLLLKKPWKRERENTTIGHLYLASLKFVLHQHISEWFINSSISTVTKYHRFFTLHANKRLLKECHKMRIFMPLFPVQWCVMGAPNELICMKNAWSVNASRARDSTSTFCGGSCHTQTSINKALMCTVNPKQSGFILFVIFFCKWETFWPLQHDRKWKNWDRNIL